MMDRFGKKKIIASAVIVIVAVALVAMVWTKVKPNVKSAYSKLNMNFSASEDFTLQLYWSDGEAFSEEKSTAYAYKNSDENVDVALKVDPAAKCIRVDFGQYNNEIIINDMSLLVDKTEIGIALSKLVTTESSNNIKDIYIENNNALISAADGDPWVAIDIDDLNVEEIYRNNSQTKFLIIDILLTIGIVLMACFCMANIESLFRVPLDIYRDRAMFWDLAKNDFQARFAGSTFGIFWGFFQPLITLLLYWFVFQVGLRAGSVSSYPFVLYLMGGLIPWFYFSEAWGGATNSLFEYSYLVKKVVFNVGILPVIKVSSAIFVHLFFVIILLLVCCGYGYYPDLYWLQLLYYIPLIAFLALGISYVTAACTAFFRDMSQIVNICLTIGVWITPIMWNPVTILSPRLATLFKINPFYYIVDGFRDALLAKVWFWEKPVWTLYVLALTMVIYIVGVRMFNRLKVHFSDVL